MTLEEIQSLWSKDSEVDRTALGEEASKIPQLHSKYFKIFSTERLKLRHMELVNKQLYVDLWESVSYTHLRAHETREDLVMRVVV